MLPSGFFCIGARVPNGPQISLPGGVGGACLHAQALPVSGVQVLPSGFVCIGARVPNGPQIYGLAGGSIRSVEKAVPASIVAARLIVVAIFILIRKLQSRLGVCFGSSDGEGFMEESNLKSACCN